MLSLRTWLVRVLGAGQGVGQPRPDSGTVHHFSHWSHHRSCRSNRSNQTPHPPPLTLSRLLYCFQISDCSCECLKLLVIEPLYRQFSE